MAPVKTTARATRSTRAATVAKENAAAATKKLNAPATRKPAAKTIEPTTTTRKSRTKVDEPTSEDETSDMLVEPEVTVTRSTRNNTVTKNPTLSVAPRRRIKVTRLDAPEEVIEAKEPRKDRTTRTRKTKDFEPVERSPATEQEKTKSKSKPQPNSTKETTSTSMKTRGRPKRAAESTSNVPEITKKVTRTSRTTRAEPVTIDIPEKPKSTTVNKKKVTFQDVSENDKENQPLLNAKVKKAAVKETAAAGMRARPIRKPVSTRAATLKPSVEKKMPKALTPKKITQVAKAIVSDQEMSDEDELNSGKTPVRDLSMSPRRPPTSAAAVMVRDMSPIRPAIASLQTEHLTSSRKPLASPFKDTIGESPKRGMGNVSKLLFPSSVGSQQTNGMVAIALNPSGTIAATTGSTLLHQSPKRSTIMDTERLFPGSAMKSTNKSPLKVSLLGSPAKRSLLFSPKKSSITPLTKSIQPESSAADDMDVTGLVDELEADVVVSSHQRASMSPLRVQRITDDLDFDQSVLAVGSPLKLAKSPIKSETIEIESTESVSDDESIGSEMESPISQKDDVTIQAPLTVSQQDLELNHYRDEKDSSEDELAAEKTPIARLNKPTRPNIAGFDGRLSTGVPQSVDGKGFGFTPLMEHMNGWKASSPEKEQIVRRESSEFSPLARQHIDGEVTVSRNNTPVQKLNLKNRKSLNHSTPQTNQTRRSLGLRKSLANRQSLAFSTIESPLKNALFDEQMEILDQEVEQPEDDLTEDALTPDDFDEIMNVEDQESMESGNEDDTILVHDQDEPSKINQDGELTTDLINYTNATDTAIVDFAQLANEASVLAVADVGVSDTDGLEAGSDDDAELEPEIMEESSSPELYQTEINSSEDDPGMVELTPVAQPIFNTTRFANTVISKVPLKPEGQISPVKMPKKRALSFGAKSSQPSKRVSFGKLRDVNIDDFQATIPVDEEIAEAQRRTRSSEAPSPGGTSTPASRISRSTRSSMGQMSPGRMSFGISDFGDSTLDGIDLPDELDESIELDPYDDTIELAPGELTGLVNLLQVTPRPQSHATPSSFRSTRSMIAKTPSTIQTKTSKPLQDRTPFKPVMSTFLNGTIVFVDVRTSEGADASGIFTELLTTMGAKCVRDWRSRASLADVESEKKIDSNVSHVVFKDGSPKTLEKIRQSSIAGNNIWCVGVGWVLDCEREGKWIDETNYLIDSTINHGKSSSRRRKSMEPRALISDGFGSVKRSTSRRSVSTELLEEAKKELLDITTPRTVKSSNLEDEDPETPDDMSTPTGYVAYDPRTAMTPGPMTPYLISEGKKLVQMSAPPKQSGGSLFDQPDEMENQENEKPNKEFKLKNGKPDKARRQTLGFKPVVGSPLGREIR